MNCVDFNDSKLTWPFTANLGFDSMANVGNRDPKNGNRETKAHARDTTKIQITDSMEKSSPTRARKMWMSKRRESDFRDKRSNYVLKQHSFLRGVWRIVYKLVTVLFHTVYAPDGETRKNESESPLNERDIFNSITRKGKKETTNEIHTFKKKMKRMKKKVEWKEQQFP